MNESTLPERRGTSHALAWAVAATFILVVGYTAAYFGLSQTVVSGPAATLRRYPSAMLARLFVPAAWMEAKYSRKLVAIVVVNKATPEYSYVAEP